MGIEQRPIRTKPEAQSAAAQALTESLGTFRLKGPVLFLISGGSALRVLDYIDPSVFDSQITVSMADERATSDERYNNFLQFKKTEAYQRMRIADSPVIETVPNAKESLQEFAQNYDRKIAAWFDQNIKNHVKGHVLGLFGMGEDGHTSGIMTDLSRNVRHRLLEPERYIVGYQTDHGAYPRRATASVWFLRNRIDDAIVYAWGESKIDAIRMVLAPRGYVWKTPARIFAEVKYPVVLFTSPVKNT